jgi:hypothetical protein
MLDSPIFTRDDCGTCLSAASAGAEERTTKEAKTTRVFMGEWLSSRRE